MSNRTSLSAAAMIGTSGMYGNVLRLQPPLSITTGELDELLAALQRVLPEVARR